MTQLCPKCDKPVEAGANFCANCGARLHEGDEMRANLEGKRAKVLGHKKPQKRGWIRTTIIIAVLALFGGWLYSNLPKGEHSIIGGQPTVAKAELYPSKDHQMFDIPSKVESGKIIVPLDVIMERKFVAFNYIGEKSTTPLLAYISGEGKLITAISMCEPCNSMRFHIRGEELVCNACGTTWELDNLRAISGACGKYPPDVIPSIVVGNEVQIDENLVIQWRRRI